MTKKDYELIADAMADTARQIRDLELSDTVLFIAVENLADRLQAQNERFDRRRFLTYALPSLQP